MSEPTPKMYIALKLGDKANLVVGEMISESDVEIVLRYPILMNMFRDDEGMLAVATSKYFMFSSNDKVAFLKNQVTAVTTPRQELIRFYTEFVERFQDKINNDLEPELLMIGALQAPMDDSEGLDAEVPKNVVLH